MGKDKNYHMDSHLNQPADESFWVLGDLYNFKVTGKQTNGALTIIHQIIQPQSGPPPHIHHREDEAFYVLEGKFTFLNGDNEQTLETGAFVYILKGTLHTFKNIDTKPGKLMVIITPAGLEDFFYSIGTPAIEKTPPPADPVDINMLMQLAQSYHMDIIVPGQK